MCSIFRTTFRGLVILGVLGAVVAGGTMLVAGPERAKAIFHQTMEGIHGVIDDNIQDPVALRNQLQDLERQYPERIAQVRGDLAELNQQVRQLERQQKISERVVAMAESDLDELQGKIAEAAASATGANLRLATLTFDDHVLAYDRAVSRAGQIQATRVAYSNRAADCAHDLAYMRQQAGRLEELLAKLETERSEFQSQILQLSRQVDSIARNERLIALMEERNKTIEECSRYEVVSLDQLTQRLAEYRSRQEAELEMLTSDQRRVDYEEMARTQLENEAARQVDLETFDASNGDGPLYRVDAR
jgi:chromosome segregation ATPase